MIEKVTIAAAPARSPWFLTIALAASAATVLLAGMAVAPYVFQGATLESEVSTQVSSTTGLVLTHRGPARFDLLPRPHVVMRQVHVADPTGTLTIDADSLSGEVRLLPLLVGRLELASATLVRPALVIDLEGRPMGADNTIGRAIRTTLPPKSGQRLGIVTLLDGTALVKGRMFSHSPRLEAINVTVDWRDLDSPATLTGSAAIQAIHTEIAAWIADPSSLMRGDRSQMTLRLQSTPLDVTASGDLINSETATFNGRLTVTAPSLPVLLGLGGYETAGPAPFANVTLTSDSRIGVDRLGQTSLDLQALRLRLDGNDYEGTLAYQGGAKPALSGTLATEQLSLSPFLHRVPKVLDGDRHWARTAVAFAHADPVDLDLRISATHLRIPPFVVEDAALAVMTRHDRTEIALVEGKAYGGAAKGRLSLGGANGDLSLRASGTLGDADALSLSWDAFGRQVAAGTISGAANFESTGDSPEALMSHLQGWARGHATDGELSGIDLGRGLRELERQRIEAILPALHGGRTPFHTLTFSARIVDGVASLDEAAVNGPEAQFTIAGQTDIGKRSLDLHAFATAPSPATAKMRFDVGGTFDKIVVAPDIGGMLNQPKAAP